MNKPDLTPLNLKTERLVLRPLTFEDTPFITKLLNDPDYIRNIGDRKVRTTDDAGHYLTTGPMESYKTHGYGLLCTTLKPETEKSAGTPIGTCGLLKRDFLDYPDLGYAFLPEFRAMGYAGEAAAGVLQWGKKIFDFSRIGAIVNPDNQASIRLLERIGFSYEKEVTIPETKKAVKLFVAEL